MVEVFPKTMPKPWNGIESPLNKEMLMLNVIWAICIIMVEVFPETMPKQPNGIESPPNKEMLLLNVIWAICTNVV